MLSNFEYENHVSMIEDPALTMKVLNMAEKVEQVGFRFVKYSFKLQK
jgi:hypothetical protein